MGLDMYFFRRSKGCEELPDTEELYLRKANQIRRWIVHHTDYPNEADCVPHVLTKDQLVELAATCRKVLSNRKSAGKLMPTSDGFFFGSTEYDEWYFHGLITTAEGIERIIRTTDFDSEEVVYYEWY